MKPVIETLTCTTCSQTWTRERKRGTKPSRCPSCTTRPSCLHCGRDINRNGHAFCWYCSGDTDALNAHGVRLSHQYKLQKGDPLHNGLCFLHACGHLEPFMDRIDSIPAVLAYRETQQHASVPVKFSPAVLDRYERAGMRRTSVWSLGT
jgi:hypothetical protein